MRMAGWRPVCSALRTPLLLIGGIYWVSHGGQTLVKELVILQSRHNAFHAFFCAPLHSFFSLTPSQHDCFFYLPTTLLSVSNTVNLLGSLIILIGGIELVRWLRLRGRFTWGDRRLVMAGLAVAAIPWLVIVHLEGPRIRLLPFVVIATIVLWGLIVLNIGLRAVERFIATRRWVAPLMERTFPISDLVWFTFHRSRIGWGAGVLRYVPLLSYMTILLVSFGRQASLWRSSPTVTQVPIHVYDPHRVIADDQGFWYAETIGLAAGLWRYETSAATAHPFLRAQDLRGFILQDGFLYLYDGFEQTVLKVDAHQRRILWRVPLPPRVNVVDLVAGGGMIVVVGQEGYVAVVDEAGHKQAERTFASQTWSPQMLAGARMALISPNQPSVRLLTMALTDAGEIPLPLSESLSTMMRGDTGERPIPVITGTAYIEPSGTFYVSTLWGEILRYDLGASRWLPSYHAAPGISAIAADAEHGLLFLYNHVRGYLEIMALDTGAHLTFIKANVFGNALTLDPRGHVVFLSARGPGATSVPLPGGIYQWDYRALMPPKRAG